jgi:hypothetical protein
MVDDWVVEKTNEDTYSVLLVVMKNKIIHMVICINQTLSNFSDKSM